jgi:diguanylate cyclase (GGDEF)-like protein
MTATPSDDLSDQLRRERLLDLEERIAPYRRGAFAVLGVGLILSGPSLGWWWLIPLAFATLAFVVADRRLARSDRPELWVAAGWAVSPLMIAVSVALTGAADSPSVSWFALPALTLAARFERRGIAYGAAYLFGLMACSTVLLEPSVVAADPPLLIFPVALTLAAMLLSGAVVQSDREHRRSAVVDELTGLLNRSALAQRVAELQSQALKAGDSGPIGLLVGDLDHFKAINDEHGHAAGDNVLRDAAYAMRGSLRAFDLIYRLGGEEFLILLPGADQADAVRVAERVRAAVAGCSSPGIEVSISFGAATVDGRGGFDFSSLYNDADRALYEAKHSGRDRVLFADPADHADERRRPRALAPLPV